jgi:hypothetical protein
MNKIIGGFDLVEFVEKSYSCSGFCKPGLFYMSRPLSAGIPSNTCLKSFSEAFKGAKPLAGLIVATAVWALITWLF